MLAAALSRRWWIAGVLTLALAVVSSGLALAGTPGYSVKVSVPAVPVRQGQTVRIVVHGDAIDRAGMDLYTSRPACLPNWKDEVNLAKDGLARLRIGSFERGAFSRQFDLPAAEIGTHHACAYLFSTVSTGHSGKTLAHVAAYWLVRSAG